MEFKRKNESENSDSENNSDFEDDSGNEGANNLSKSEKQCIGKLEFAVKKILDLESRLEELFIDTPEEIWIQCCNCNEQFHSSNDMLDHYRKNAECEAEL